MRRILITGVAGFIGSRFAQWVQENHPEVEIYGVDDLSGGDEQNIPEGVEWLVCRLGDPEAEWDLADAYAGYKWPTPDVVFHFAAYAAECLSPFIRRYNYRNNVEATAEVVNFCINRDVKRLVFTSSIAVYGHTDCIHHENEYCQPGDPYGVAKLACEHDIRIAGEQHGLDWCVLRPHNVYGTGQNLWDRYRNVLGIWMREAHAGRPIVVFGDGSQERQFTYIDDILPCLWEAGTSSLASKRVYNLGADKMTSLKELAECVSEVTGAPIQYTEARHEAMSPFCNHYRAKKELGFEENTMLLEGIHSMWDWAKEELNKYPDRQSPVMPREIEKGIYKQWA